MAERGTLFSGMFGHGETAAAVSDAAFVQAMIDVEVALLRALGRSGLAPPDAADEVARSLDGGPVNLDALARSTGEHGTPVPGLLGELRARCGREAAAHLHEGATSQDVVDTAMMLVASRALGVIVDDLRRAADACAALSMRHREALLPGRTLLQHALPLSFGLKVATWCSALDDARADLKDVRERTLAVQLGGAVGTLARLGEHGVEVLGAVARELELAEPRVPWHTIRLRPARLASALGAALGVMGKIARDIVLLAQSEVAELATRAGGSSTLPHKRNPIGAIAVVACAERAPGLVATMFSTMVQEHERAAGAWQAEWETLLELLRLCGSAAASLREALAELEVDSEKMARDLGITGGALMSESVVGALADSVGTAAARKLVQDAARRALDDGLSFRDTLLEVDEVRHSLGEDGVDAALDPRAYVGATQELIDRVLDAHASSRT